MSLPRVHLCRYGGWLAPHSQLRGAIILTSCPQGADGHATSPGSPRWNWARLLKRVFALDTECCPFCQRESLRIIAAITQVEVIKKMLRHVKLSTDPPPSAPARSRHEAFGWVACRARSWPPRAVVARLCGLVTGCPRLLPTCPADCLPLGEPHMPGAAVSSCSVGGRKVL